MKIALHKCSSEKLHSSSWIPVWENYLLKNKISYEFVDCTQYNIIEKLNQFNILLWHFSQYNLAEMLEARSILYSAKKMGLKTFPDFNEAWHFDDKIAEMYALQSVDAPIPNSFVFYDINSFTEWLDTYNQFPIVGKLRTGSGSHNIKLLHSKKELYNYGRRMLIKGYNPAPSLLYKTSSNIRSSHNWNTFIKKAKRIPEFLRNLSNAKEFPNEKGYIYLQEFIPNDNYDLKVVVVGDKLSGVARPVRSHDFRASGGGEIYFDKKLFTKEIIKTAFETSDKLAMQCIGYDYVVNKETDEGLIVEMSYGFSHAAILSAGGYFDRDCVWHDEPLNVPHEIIKNILSKR